MTPSVFECCILNHGVFINCSKESIVMKKISFEKKMLGVMVILSLLSVFLFYIGMKGVEEAGGFKQIAIEAAKDFKDVKKEVKDYTPE